MNYGVEIDSKGRVLLTNESATIRSEGEVLRLTPSEDRSQISKKQLLELVHRFGALGFLDIDQAPLDQRCVVQNHGSFTSLSLTVGGRSHTVGVSGSCRVESPLPGALMDLKRAMLTTVKHDDFIRKIRSAASKANKANKASKKDDQGPRD